MTSAAALPAPSGSGSVSALASPSPTAIVTAAPVPAAVTKLRFEFDRAVPAADEAAIRDGVARTIAFLESSMGGDAVRQVVVYASRPGGAVPLPDHPGGCCNFNNKDAITLDVSSDVWGRPGPYTLDAYHTKIAAHEYFHAWQRALGCSFYFQGQLNTRANMPAWLVEGAAEFVALQRIIEAGMITSAKVRSDAMWEAQAKPSAVPQGFETAPPLTPLPFGILYLALERLTAEGGFGKYRTFCASVGAGGRWQDAFATTFGLTPEAFYDDYAKWRANGFR